MGVYGKRAIQSNLPNYIKYVRYGINSWLSYGPVPYMALWLLALVIGAFWIAPMTQLPVAAIAMFMVHLGTGLLVAALEGVTPRYLYPTLYPYIVAVLCCIAGQLRLLSPRLRLIVGSE